MAETPTRKPTKEKSRASSPATAEPPATADPPATTAAAAIAAVAEPVAAAAAPVAALTPAATASSGAATAKPSVLSERVGAVLRIVMNRVDARNALNIELARRLREALDDAAAEEDVRAVVLASTGPGFSVGGDAKLMFDAGSADRPDLLVHLINHFHAAITSIATMAKPVVAAVRGGVGGGGVSIMLACDLVVIDEKAKLAMGFNALGLSPDGGSTHHLPRAIGLKRATELCMLNTVIDGKRAVEWGLANRAVPEDKVDEEAMALATLLAAGPTRAFARTKEMLRAERSLAETLPVESESIAALGGEVDAGEGLEAFVEKRKPRFRGK